MSKSQSRKASEVLAFRMTPDESEALRAAAAMSGLGPTTFARRAAFAAAAIATPVYEAKSPNLNKAELAKIYGALGRMASSANQMAKIAHAAGQLHSPKLLKELMAEIRGLRDDVARKS